MSGWSDQQGGWAVLAGACQYRVTEMARRCGISPRHLRRLFKKVFNTHPKQQVDAWRAQAIADQIRNGLSVKEAGSNQKFKQASHVSQFVKRVLKNSPRDFRDEAVRFP